MPIALLYAAVSCVGKHGSYIHYCKAYDNGSMAWTEPRLVQKARKDFKPRIWTQCTTQERIHQKPWGRLTS